MTAAPCLFLSLLLCLVSQPGPAAGDQIKPVQPKTIALWPDGAPGALGKEASDTPELTIYLPPKNKATGAAIVICPGGGYGGLAINHEGHDVARWLNSIGVAGIILKYRHAPRYHHPAPLQDAQRAIRLVRFHAKNWGIDPNKVGILGFSAGGHLASTAATHFDAGNKDAKDEIKHMSCRPDFAVLVYPVITLTGPFAHNGSRNNLLGKNQDAKLIESLCNEKQVTAQTPPTFLVHTTEDTAVPPENSILFYQALRKAKVPCELHIFEQGRHGLGLGTKNQATAHDELKMTMAVKNLEMVQAELEAFETYLRQLKIEVPPKLASDKKGKENSDPDWLLEDYVKIDPVARKYVDRANSLEKQLAEIKNIVTDSEDPAIKRLTVAVDKAKKAQVAYLEIVRPKIIVLWDRIRAAKKEAKNRYPLLAEFHSVLSDEVQKRTNAIQNGFGNTPGFSAWPQLCEAWLKVRKITTK